MVRDLTIKVLEHLVERRPHVHVAVGKRGTVMQDKQRGAGPRLLNLLVEAVRLPLRKHLRLAGGQTGLHGKVRLREIQGVLVTAHW